MKQSHHRRHGSASATKMILPPSYLRSNSYNGNNRLSTADHQMTFVGNYCYRIHADQQSSGNKYDAALAVIPQRSQGGGISSLISSLLRAIPIPTTFVNIPAICRRWWSNSNIISSAASSAIFAVMGSKRMATVTLFGYRKGHAFLAIQDNPRYDSPPLLHINLPISTSALVKEMSSSGVLRIALECDKARTGEKRNSRKLLEELEWTMYCNSRKCGTARSMEQCNSDFAKFVLSTVRSISVGAGVIPVISHDGNCNSGELMYMRARYERVVGNRNSEAFYMLNPDGHSGGPELSIFLLRL